MLHEGPAAQRAFPSFTARLDQTVFIVTTVGDRGERAGCLVGFAAQCSISPPRFLALLSVLNRTHQVAESADLLAVHTVARGAQPLAALFAGETGDEVDKFARCSWTPGPGGVPILEECPNWFAGRILSRVRGLGDHTGYLLEPVAVELGDPGEALLGIHDVAGIEAGHPESS